MLRQKRKATGTRSIYTRMMRLVIPILMGTFLIIGLVLLFGIRTTTQDTVTQNHHALVNDFIHDVTTQIQQRVDDLNALASQRDAHDFARDTLINTNSGSLNASQTRLLGDFTSLLQQHADYLAVRYITFNGSVWSEVTNYDGTIPRADATVKLGTFAKDASLAQALAISPGQVVVSDITFATSPTSLMGVPFIRISAPVAPDSSFETNIAGVVQLDVLAQPLLDIIRSTANPQAANQPGRRELVANHEGLVLYDTDNPNANTANDLALHHAPLIARQFPSVAALFQADAPPVDAQVDGQNVFSTGRINFTAQSSAFWTVTIVDNAALLEGGSTLLALGALIGSLLIGALLCFVIGMILRRALRPIGSITTQWTGEAAASLEITSNDEVGQLMRAFQGISMKVETLKDELDAQQGRYTRNMDIAARISRETATLSDIDELLNRAVELICTEFGFYHAQVFLIDDIGENALLTYSHGEVGQQLLQSGHKIVVGSASVIGKATSTGTAVVVNDTSNNADAPHQFNALLPQTRAEIALPLLFGERVIGALDVQSTQPDSFQADEARTFQILADQIAVAIQNARLLVQSEQRVTQIDTLNRQLTRTAWQETSESSDLHTVYRYDLLQVKQDEPTEEPTLSLPIAIRGEVVGTLDAAPPEGTFFTEGDRVIMRAVAERVALAIENVRLFDETQNTLAETFMLYQLSRDLNEASSLDDILSAIIRSVMPDAVGGQIGLFADYASVPETLVIVVDWTYLEISLVGTQIRFADHALLYEMQPDQVALITDIERDARIDAAFQALVREAHAMVLIPFSVRGVWRGVIMVEFPTTRDFGMREERTYGALIDQAGIAIDNSMLLRQNQQALGDNQRLLLAAESERERLSLILESLPAGVLVLDAVTYKPIQFNKQIEELLGQPIMFDQAFDAPTYKIYRTGTDVLYPADSLPIYLATQMKELAASDDITIKRGDGIEIDLLMNAVPIVAADGSVSAVITAFQDITTLRSLERTLETNLRETVTLYETTRAFSEAEEVEQVLDEVIGQLATQNASDAYVLLLDDQLANVQIAQSLSGATGAWMLPADLLNPRTALYIMNVQTEFDLDEVTRQALLDANIAAIASMPMRARSRRDVPLGWLVATFDQVQDFTPEREQFLSTLNENAAVALDNRYLLESTETALKETAAIYGATTNLSRARTREEIAAAIEGAFESLAPNLYAAYFRSDDQLAELFNVSLDAAPIDFSALIAKDNLLDEENLFIDDLREIAEPTPFERDLIALGNIRGLALVHIRSQNIPVGFFFIGYHDVHRFSGGDARYLASIADSASVVVDNYLLLDQIQSSLEETSILYQASRALNDASSASEILDVIVSNLISRPFTQVFIALLSTENWDNPKAMAQIAATWQREGETGIDLTGVNLVAEQYPAWRLLASPEVLTIDDVSESNDLDVMERIGVESLELRSLSVLPLRIAGRSIGAVVIGGRAPYQHTERDQRIYRSLAEQASLRMEAARLLAQTERRARQLTTSFEVSQIASSILDLSILLPRIVDLIRDSFGYDHVQIFLMDDANNYAELRASTGDPGRQLMEIRHKLQKGSASVIGRVTSTGDSTIASDTADARVIHRPNPYLPNTRSEMAIPLKLKGRVVGALDVQSNQPNAFDDDDVTVATTLAAQISVAIDNAQLFDQARNRANEMSFLFDVTTAAAAAETLQVAIQNVANELRKSLQALSVSVYLPQQYEDTDKNELTMLEPVALAGSDQPLSELSEVRLDSENNAIADSARSHVPMIIENIHSRSDYLPVVDGARSAIIVPLTAGTQMVGLVALESAEVGAYGDDTLTLLLTLSGTLSAIIQNQQLLEQVQQTNEQLRELDRLKSDFLANMSHELRTPLNSIIGFSRVILKGIDGALTEMQEQDLTTIYNSGLHLLNLINDILDQAKIAAGKMDLQFDYFEMKNVIDGVRSIGIGLVKDKQIDIFVDIAPGLPKAYGDEFRTRQILINLISNAAKFTREGSITISCYPVRDEESGMMMLRADVTDTGIGIAEKDMPLLFEAFRQVDSSLTRTQGGTGLGLPISKSLIEMQGGRMIVSSHVNIGSTFSILMPVEPVIEQEEKPKKKTTDHLSLGRKTGNTGPLLAPSSDEARETTETEPPGYTHTKRQILLIEDNPDMVDQYRRALQREGFDIFTASIPLEAEAMASGLHPTLIIMDVNFGDGQGWSILGKLKARDDTFDIPVIIVTLSNERDRACDMGTFRFIQRPFTPDELVAAVQDGEKESRIDRILIIDDQPESVRLLKQVLDEQGQYRVFSASNGAEGIALVARRRPNLVILDLRMPDMDGFQVVQELRNNPETATIPILVVTGDSLSAEESSKLSNLSVLHKGVISANEYRQFMDGVKSYLSGA